MVFYFAPESFPCNIDDWQDHKEEIYEAIAQDMNLRDDEHIYDADPYGDGIWVTTSLPEEDPDFDNYLLSIGTVEEVSPPAGDRIKIILSA